MAVVGAILGDISGSQYEFEGCRPSTGINWENCSLFTDRCVFTDDTVLTLAVKKAILENRDFADVFREFADRYDYVGYGTRFHKWLLSGENHSVNSCGNGSAMRISYIAERYARLKDAQQMATESAICTHNHPEGIKGAVVAVTCMWMALHHADRHEIEAYAVQQYPSSEYEFGCDLPIEEYRDFYRFDATCQGSVPVAIRCFLESDCYESCLRLAYSLHCDLDTICCIAGGIAESFYRNTGFDDQFLLERYLDDELRGILREKERN